MRNDLGWTRSLFVFIYYIVFTVFFLLLQNDKVDSGCRVFDIPEASEFQQTPGRVNVSLCFASQQLAVLADGTGRLFLLQTGHRKQKSMQWKVSNLVFYAQSAITVISGRSVEGK